MDSSSSEDEHDHRITAEWLMQTCAKQAESCHLSIIVPQEFVRDVRQLIRENVGNCGSLDLHVPHFYKIRQKDTYLTYGRNAELMNMYVNAADNKARLAFIRAVSRDKMCSENDEHRIMIMYEYLSSCLDPDKQNLEGRKDRLQALLLQREAPVQRKLTVSTRAHDWPLPVRTYLKKLLRIRFPPKLFQVTFTETSVGLTTDISRLVEFDLDGGGSVRRRMVMF